MIRTKKKTTKQFLVPNYHLLHFHSLFTIVTNSLQIETHTDTVYTTTRYSPEKGRRSERE